MQFIILIVLLGSVFAERPEEAPPPLERQTKEWELPHLNPIVFDVEMNCTDATVDLIFVLDESGSIGSQDFAAVRQFTRNVVNAIGFPGSRVGVVEFNTVAVPIFPLNRYSSMDEILAALSALPYNGGGTMIANGMNYATNTYFTAANGDRPDITDVMVVMTDGQDNSDVNAAHNAAAAKGIKVIAIGVGPSTYMPELLAIAGGDPSLVFTVESFNNLSAIVTPICKEIKNPCNGNPCENGGTCIPTNDGDDYVCNCTSEYSGAQCQSPSNPCWSNPCQNGATCSAQSPTVYSCVCPPGFTGENCQNPFCQNGGKFSCSCPYGYTGPLCETLIDFCDHTIVIENGVPVAISICVHGTCENTPHGPVCHCSAGYTGQWCEVDIPNCASNPCENGGTCEEKPGDAYSCCCDPLHTGANCENNVNFCDDLEILNGANGQPVHVSVCGPHGECITTPSGAICNCLSDGNVIYTGEFCEDEIPYNCSHNGITYPHNSTWYDGCDQCLCEYGKVECSHSFWCPQRCALYETPQTQAANIPTSCPANENCVPDELACAKPVCDYPIGWCFPTGMVMVATAPPRPTNPPNGWQWA